MTVSAKFLNCYNLSHQIFLYRTVCATCCVFMLSCHGMYTKPEQGTIKNKYDTLYGYTVC